MIHKTVQLYEDKPEVILTSYVLNDSTELLNGQKRAGILICPGGGYLGCSDREAEPVALRFAAMGYHAFVLRYSTYYGKFTGFKGDRDFAPKPETSHPAPVRDIGKAFLTLHEHADEWLLDMDKIILCGFSAGGHNCAMYSVYWDKPLITEHFNVDASRLKPAAAIICYALTDYFLTLEVPTNPFAKRIRRAAAIALLGTAEADEKLLTEVSPARLVSASTPPTFLWATGTDDVVPVEHATRMANALAQAGVAFETHIFEEGRHGLSLANQATAGSQLELEPDAAIWIDLAEAWLQKRFVLDLPEKPAWMLRLEAQKEGAKQ